MEWFGNKSPQFLKASKTLVDIFMKTLVKINIFFLMLVINASAQTMSSLISDSEIKELITSEIEKKDDNSERIKKVKPKIIEWSLWAEIAGISSGYIKSKTESVNDIFTNADFEYMSQQIKAEKKTVWGLNLKKGKLKANSKNNYYLYSIPLYDKTHEKAIFIKDYTCGRHCGKTTIEVYIKTENVWKFYKSVFLFES